MPPASSDGSSGVSDCFYSIFYILGVDVRDRDDHCPMGGSDDTGTLLDLWGYPDPSDLVMAHPLDVGFSRASYSGFSVEQLHYITVR